MADRSGVRLRGSRVRVELVRVKMENGREVVYKLPNSSFLLLQFMVGAFLPDRF